MAPSAILLAGTVLFVALTEATQVAIVTGLFGSLNLVIISMLRQHDKKLDRRYDDLDRKVQGAKDTSRESMEELRTHHAEVIEKVNGGS